MNDNKTTKIGNFKTPKILYKYRSINEFTCRSIVKKETFFADPYRFNDPLEPAILGLNQGNFQEAITNQKRLSAILCLSKVYDCTKMWSHYGDEFRGICIGYNTEKLISSTAKHKFKRFYKVKYKKNHTKRIKTEHLIASKDEQLQEVYATKSYAYKYEREYRVIIEPHPKYHEIQVANQAYAHSKDSIEEIIFGISTPPCQIEIIQKLLNSDEHRPNYYVLTYDEKNYYKLKKRPILEGNV